MISGPPISPIGFAPPGVGERQGRPVSLATWEKGASRVIDCEAIGGSVGEKDCPGLGG